MPKGSYRKKYLPCVINTAGKKRMKKYTSEVVFGDLNLLRTKWLHSPVGLHNPSFAATL